MNCKPGDIAVLINTPPEFTEHIGMVVRVVRLAHVASSIGPGWIYEGRPILLPSGTPVVGIEDAFLRPLRDPGDSAVDEMLLLVGSPTKETA